MSNSKIIIIGAGAAGIGCATKLLKYGFKDVTILEGRSRIGGRIDTIPYGDNVIDLGAQWCHGQRHNVVYDLVKDLNLLESSGQMQDDYMLVRSNGEVLSKKLTARLLSMYDELKRRRETLDTPTQGDALNFYKQEYEKLLNSTKNLHIDRTIAAEFWQNFVKFENSAEGTNTLAELSAAGDEAYEDCEGDQLLNWKDKGYKTILNILMHAEDSKPGREYGILQNRIKFDTKVTCIHWAAGDGKMLIETAQSEDYIAEHVIVTVSLGVLKAQHMTLFEPKLPPNNITAIESIDFGVVNKIFIEFTEKFWPDDWTGFALLWLEEDLNQIRGTKRAWLEDVVGFFGVNYQPRVLVGWISGTSARHIETLDVAEIQADCLEVFRRFLPWQIPTPANFKVTAWSTNELFRGSYSYHSSKTEQLGLTSEALANPLLVDGKLRVQFAGEATSTQHYSTVHGALKSGWHEAARLAECYGMATK